MIRLLHCADALLDTPLSLPDLGKTDLRRAELRAVFSSLTLYVRKNGVRLVLIAGDLFHNSFLTPETLQLLQREFAACPACHFVIAPGSHDCYTPEGIYAMTRFPQNVHIFTSGQLACFRLDDIGADVWGFANTAPEMNGFQPLEGFRVRDRSRLNIFCGSCDITGEDSTAAVITKEQLARAGFDYAALGSRRNSDGIRRIGGTYFGYAGCLEGRSFTETGYKGAFCGDLSKKEDGTAAFTVRRLRFSRRHLECETVDLTGCRDLSAAAETIRQALAPKNYDSDAAMRLTLTGTVPAAMLLTEDALRPLLPPFFLFELCDCTARDHDLAWLEHDPTLRGAFYRELKPYLESDSENDRETAYLALRLGLQAMGHKD
ncbi:MAG: hypothetical protein MJ175_06270 [Clostridia bacterium]|nr:hypothetical protein [Clostridia bacterium]